MNSETYHAGSGLASLGRILPSNSQSCEVNETKSVSLPLRQALEYGTWDLNVPQERNQQEFYLPAD